eukprot:1588425-Rhodomonas_salina.1
MRVGDADADAGCMRTHAGGVVLTSEGWGRAVLWEQNLQPQLTKIRTAAKKSPQALIQVGFLHAVCGITEAGLFFLFVLFVSVPSGCFVSVPSCAAASQ